MDDFIIKLASLTTTYSPTASASRNYTPKKPSITPRVVKINAAQEKKVETPKFEKTDLPKDGKNVATNPDHRDAFARPANDFKNSISGTGYGRPYWVDDGTRNAYSLS